jgi:PAS domain S-box-containing protein
LTEKRKDEGRWIAAGLALATAIAAVDIVVGETVTLISLQVLAPLVVAMRATWHATGAVAAYAFVVSLLLGITDHIFFDLNHLTRVAAVLLGGIAAIWIAYLRQRRERAEGRAMFMAEAGTQLDAALDYRSAARTLTRLVVPQLADWGAVFELEHQTVRQIAVTHSDPSKEEVAWELDRRYPFHLEQPVGPAEAIRTKRGQLMAEVTDEAIELTAYDAEHARLFKELGLRSALFVPITARGRMLGALALATAESGRRFDADDLAFAENLVGRASVALDNARLFTQLAATGADLRRSRDEIEAILQGVASAITVQNKSGDLVYANEAAARTLGFTSVDDLLATPPEMVMERFEICDEAREPFDPERLPGRIALAGGKPPDTEICFRDRASGEERWSLVKARPIFDEEGATVLVVNIIDDITEQKRAELSERFLSECSRVLFTSLDYETMLDGVAHLAAQNLADMCKIDVADQGGRTRTIALALEDPSKLALAQDVLGHHPGDAGALVSVVRVLSTGEPQLERELREDRISELTGNRSYLALLESIEARSVMAVPMIAGGKTVGAITLARTAGRSRFDDADLALAAELGRRTGAATENAWLYAERAHIARTLQRSLLPPRLPDVPGLEVAARFRPAGEGYDVGGDFYDVFNTGATGWAVVIGDVCGKGPEAAALTGLARYTLRAAAMQENEPSRILAMLSEAILQQRADSQFCTAAYGRIELEPVGVRLTVASGGHPLPLLLTEDGRVETVGAPGTLLGVIPDAHLSDRAVHLDPGATLLFYTDGVIEAGIPRGSFGLGALESLLSTCAGASAEEIAERVEAAVVGLEGNPSDDIALLVVRVRE